MSLSYIDVSLAEGNARPLVAGPTKALVIGPCSGGQKENKLYTFSNPADMVSEIGRGPAEKAAGIILNNAPAGYKGCYVIVSSGSVAATYDSYTESGMSGTLSGTPTDTYDVRGEITKEGGRGVARFKYSLDGGNTYQANNLVPSDGVFTFTNSGVTLTFANATQSSSGTFSFRTNGPEMNTSDLNTCMEFFRVQNVTPTLILVANENSAPASGGITLANQLDTNMTTLDETNGVYTQAVVYAGGEDKLFNQTYPTSGTYGTSDVVSDSGTSSTTNLISMCAEKVNMNLANTYGGYGRPRVPLSYAYAAAAHGVGSDISLNIAKNKLPSSATPSYDEFQYGEAYSEWKIVGPRSYPGETGPFVDESWLKTQVGSSFDIWPKARVINEARRVTRLALRPWLHARVRVLTDGTGRIDPRDAQVIEDSVNKQLRVALITTRNGEGHCSAVNFSVNRETNILSTNILEGQTLVVPFAYPRSINVECSFTDTIEVEATTAA